jgi:hypothetical protein
MNAKNLLAPGAIPFHPDLAPASIRARSAQPALMQRTLCVGLSRTGSG